MFREIAFAEYSKAVGRFNARTETAQDEVLVALWEEVKAVKELASCLETKLSMLETLEASPVAIEEYSDLIARLGRK